MSRLLASTLFALMLSSVLQAGTLSVGTCNPKMPFYGTIQIAVDAASPGDTVLVCAGIYPESVIISKPLTLRGVPSGTNAMAIIQGGTRRVATVYGPNGKPGLVYAQVLVEGTGPVDISNITVDGSNTGYGARPDTYLAGLFFYNSSGTVTFVVVRGHQAGIWLDNYGNSPVSIAVQGSSIENFSTVGIFASSNNLFSPSNPASPSLSFLLKANSLGRNSATAIQVHQATGTVSDSIILDASPGVLISAGSIVGVLANTFVGGGLAVEIGSSGNSVLMNRLFSTTNGIQVGGDNNLIQGNEIIAVGGAAGIDFLCNPVKSNNVSSNLVEHSTVGIANIPGQNQVAENAFFNVGTTVTTCP